MATQFGADVTALGPADLTGTQATSPVQKAFVDTNGAFVTALGGVSDILSTAINKGQQNSKDAAEAEVVGQYVKRENEIADAAKTGQISASEAATRSRANFSSYAASNPAYIQKIKQAGEALRGYGSQEAVQDQVKAQAERTNTLKKDAQAAGYVIDDNMSPAAQQAQLEAFQASRRMDDAFGRMVRQNTEARAQNSEIRAQGSAARDQINFNNSLQDRAQKQQSVLLINELAGANVDAFGAMGSDLVAQLDAGKTTPEKAQIQLASQFTRINAGIQSAAAMNPELASSYRSLFSEMNDLYKRQLDPKTRSENLQSELQNVITRAKLTIVADPKTAALVATSNLFGNNPQVALGMQPQVANILATIATIPPGGANFTTPQVVGQGDVEKSATDLLKASVRKLEDKNLPQWNRTQIETTNSANVILKQVGDLIDKGPSPKDLSTMASFFASPEYGKLATSGAMEPQAAQAASKVFQLKYEPAVIQGVQQKLDDYLYTTNKQVGKEYQPKALGDNLEVQFSGSGIKFVPKNTATLDPTERQDQATKIATLQTSTQAINQLIHIGAHMEGTTDYQKYWENNKHIYFPTLFSKYSNLEIGAIKNGMRYMGGDANKQSSWEKVNGAGK